MSAPRQRLCPVVLAFLVVVATGCTSSRPLFTAVPVPSDRAVVYTFWGPQFLRGRGVSVHVNGTPRAVLHSGGYFPLLLPPGPTTFGYAFVANPMIPFKLSKEGMLELP